MVRDLLSQGDPSVDVDMLVLGLWLQSLADVHVVKLLTVHVKQVSVSLELRNVGGLIHITQVRNGQEILERLDESKFVEVASNDDVSILVFSKDVGDEVLVPISSIFLSYHVTRLTAVSSICS